MRIKIELTSNTRPVPINNQKNVIGYLHKLLGDNNKYHDKINKDYSLSFLIGGKLVNNNLDFKNGATIYVTTKSDDIINKIFENVFKNTEFAFGMKFKGISVVNETFYTEDNTFMMLSPTIIKLNKTKTSLLPNHENFVEEFKKHIIKKFNKIDKNLTINKDDIQIDTTQVKTKKIMLGNVYNHCFYSKIKILNNKKLSQLIYTHGLGQSTGCGFGCVTKIENHKNILGLKF